VAQQLGHAELAPDLERTSDLPLAVQLSWRLRILIASGRLAPGDRLPGVRELASGTDINVNTARAVYRRLEDEGLIASQHGRGTFVAEGAGGSPTLEHLAADAAESAREAGVDPRDLARAIYEGSSAVPLPPFDEMAPADPAVVPEPDVEPSVEGGDERAARRELRRQIARLEAELASYPEDARGEGEPVHPLLRPKGHVAGMAELEGIRDELLDRLKRARTAAERRERGHGRARAKLEEMATDPAAHKGESVSNTELGEPGCSMYEVEPRWGPVGALMNWWRIKVSSGCPLAGAA
jgi:DNA-binding transcriptional regulator YhcF (GntR family)